jgi:superfamily II DNA helicase RecQ
MDNLADESVQQNDSDEIAITPYSGSKNPEVRGIERDARKVQRKTIEMVDKTNSNVNHKKRAEEAFMKALEDFNERQDKLIQSAEEMVPKNCSKCSCVISNLRDKGCHKKTGVCFTCFTETEQHKVSVAKDEAKSKTLSQIANMDLSDYEEWLFGDEMGQRSLALIIAKLKREGYTYRPWQVSIGAAVCSLDNYNNTELIETRHTIERMPISKIISKMPEDTDGIKKVVETLKNAESFVSSKNVDDKNMYYLAGAGIVASIIPILLRNRG